MGRNKKWEDMKDVTLWRKKENKKTDQKETEELKDEQI